MSSTILIIGATGYAGKFLVRASRELKHRTVAYIRKSDLVVPEKKELIDEFLDLGVNIIFGDLYENDTLVYAIKQVEVVISALGDAEISDQTRIINAIKEAGNNVKRFIPSEFATDCGHITDSVEPAKDNFSEKDKIRKSIISNKIPYTFVIANCFAGRFLYNLCQPTTDSVPPRDTVIIPGTGDIQESDFAISTIKAVDDTRTLNTILYINPSDNNITFNDLLSLWQTKIGHTLKPTTWSKEIFLNEIKKLSSNPVKQLDLAIRYSIFISGDQTNFKINDVSNGVEAPKLFTDLTYTTVDYYLDKFIN